MRTEENFPISNEIVNQFVIANSEQWKKQTNGKIQESSWFTSYLHAFSTFYLITKIDLIKNHTM